MRDMTYHSDGTQVIDALDPVADALWRMDAREALGWPATDANLADFARLVLYALANRGVEGAVPLYGDATRLADRLNNAPDPESDA